VANAPMLMADVSLFSLWTMAIVKNAHRACRTRHIHLVRLTCDRLTSMRWRRASSEVRDDCQNNEYTVEKLRLESRAAYWDSKLFFEQ